MEAAVSDGRCATRYPIMLIHGTGARDRKRLGYWGRIPKALQDEGAAVFTGGQDSWGTIEDNAETLRQSMQKALAETGAGKLNLIAHSKGGLDARYAISRLGLAEQVASLTTLSTPHRGSRTMEKLCRMPAWLFRLAALFVNGYFRLLGDKKPDFAAVCRQFTCSYMETFNREVPDAPGVLYRSYGSVMKNSRCDWLMRVPFWVIRRIEGENDGLVTPESAKWGEYRGLLPGGRLGISHADMVDLRRRDRKGTGVRGIYVDIAASLKEAGL